MLRRRRILIGIVRKSSIIVVEDVDTTTPPKSPEPWLSFGHAQLTIAHRDLITCGDELNDKHIAFAQAILKKQHIKLSGLQSSLMLPKQITPVTASDALQILHGRGNHWIVIRTIGCCPGSVKVFDSLYSSIDQATLLLISYPTHSSERSKAVRSQGLWGIWNGHSYTVSLWWQSHFHCHMTNKV